MREKKTRTADTEGHHQISHFSRYVCKNDFTFFILRRPQFISNQTKEKNTVKKYKMYQITNKIFTPVGIVYYKLLSIIIDCNTLTDTKNILPSHWHGRISTRQEVCCRELSINRPKHATRESIFGLYTQVEF